MADIYLKECLSSENITIDTNSSSKYYIVGYGLLNDESGGVLVSIFSNIGKRIGYYRVNPGKLSLFDFSFLVESHKSGYILISFINCTLVKLKINKEAVQESELVSDTTGEIEDCKITTITLTSESINIILNDHLASGG